MRDKKRAQISTEYLIVMGFITFVIITLIGVAFYYVGGVKDKIKENQVEGFGQKMVSSAETVYYAGEPSKLTIKAYLPAGVTGIDVIGSDFLINYTTTSGLNIRAFKSNVDLSLNGTLSTNEGVQRIVVKALPNSAEFSSG
jgi:uncharacterized protein (UPF0333 family)